MSPDGGDKPDGELGSAIDEYFGSFDKFRAHFEANANAIQGSGWSMLVWDTLGQRLNIVQLYDQQSNLPLAQIPIVLLDMWEHAFYLDYKNVKADYVKAWWNVANWADAQARFSAAAQPQGSSPRSEPDRRSRPTSRAPPMRAAGQWAWCAAEGRRLREPAGSGPAESVRR